MATKKRRKKRSPVRRTLSAAPRRRRRKSGLADGAKKGIMAGIKTASGGALGGALFTGTRMIDMPLWMRTVVGYGGAVGLALVTSKAGNVSAGLAGATTYNLLAQMLPIGLLHDDSMDNDYVDADTLSDSGYMDEKGNAVLCDDDGILYQLNDSNELQAVGDLYSLQDDGEFNDEYSLASGY